MANQYHNVFHRTLWKPTLSQFLQFLRPIFFLFFIFLVRVVLASIVYAAWVSAWNIWAVQTLVDRILKLVLFVFIGNFTLIYSPKRYVTHYEISISLWMNQKLKQMLLQHKNLYLFFIHEAQTASNTNNTWTLVAANITLTTGHMKCWTHPTNSNDAFQ